MTQVQRLDVANAPWIGPRVVAAFRLAPAVIATALAGITVLVDGRALTVALGGGAALATAAWSWKRKEPLLLVAIACLGLGFVSAISPHSTATRALASVGFAAGLYLLHTTGTVAAVMDARSAIHRAVITRWTARTLGVASAGALAGGFAFVLSTSSHSPAWVGYVGVGAVVSIGVLPIALLLRTRARAAQP